MMLRSTLLVSLLSLAFLMFCECSVFALDGIMRPYQSVRSASMGGVRMTTGFYDENFFNNPARVTANPSSKFTLLQLTPIETSSSTLKAVQDVTSGTNGLQAVSNSSGSNLHHRFQLVMPAYYLASNADRNYALAIGIISSVQIDAILRQSYQLNFGGVVDLGPAITYGRKFLYDKSLSVGVTGRFTYRAATNPNYSLLDYVRGESLKLDNIAGDGAMYNFDVGTTYRFAKWGNFDMSVGGAIQNILGSRYNNSTFSLIKKGNEPPSQLRSYGVGINASRPAWGFMGATTFAFEITDVLNNPNGSIYKLLHLGGETRWKVFALRAGLNQGYLSGGLGIDLHYLSLNIATYGEELGLNAGTFEDRRYTFDIGLHI